MAKTSFFILGLLASATLSFGQSTNQAAVDTLTKDVAIAVFASINQPKAQEIYARLLECGAGCEAQQVISTVGGWDAVGAKMQELSELKNTALFIAMSPEEANTAIRKQLARFYARYKTDNNYGKPLNPAVQVRILSKIDALLPPAVTPTTQPTTTTSAMATDTVTNDGTGIDQAALQMNQLERELKDKEENQLWMMILSALIGLLIGGGAVYLFLFRRAQSEIKMLLDENARLSRSLDSARQSRPATEARNERRQPQSDYQQKATAYDAIRAELGADDPLKAIRYLKQRVVGNQPETTSLVRASEPTIEPVVKPEPASVPTVPIQPQTTPKQTQLPAQVVARNEVFYFPPPDPNGQFDIGQKSSALSPESAYRFSISADNPSVASFRFEAEPGRVARFLTYRNYMIEPACESENSYSSTYTRVAMRRDGQAVLDNGVWRVKTKALIRYE